MKDAENILTKVSGKNLTRMFKIQKALKEIEIVNEKKRDIVRRTTPAGETPQGLGRKAAETPQRFEAAQPNKDPKNPAAKFAEASASPALSPAPMPQTTAKAPGK